MAINAAEEETLETLKKWWEENGKRLVAAIVIVAAGFGGWNFWEGQQLATQGAASDLYEEILELTLVEPGQQIAADDADRIIALSSQLRDDFSQSTYASFGALFAASQHVASNDLEAAEADFDGRWARGEVARWQTGPAVATSAPLDLGGYASAAELEAIGA